MTKFTTDELLEKLYDHWKYKMYADGMKHDNEYRDAIIARLKAADVLCAMALLALDDIVLTHGSEGDYLDDAIKAYEGKED